MIRKGELIKLTIKDKDIIKDVVSRGIKNYQKGKIYSISKRGIHVGFGKFAIIESYFKDRGTKKLSWGLDMDFPVNDHEPRSDNQIIFFSNKIISRMTIEKRRSDFNINDVVKIDILKPIDYLKDIKKFPVFGKILSYDLWEPSLISVTERGRKIKRITGSIVIGCGIYSKFTKTTDLPTNISNIYPNIEQQVDFDKLKGDIILKLPVRDINIYYNIEKYGGSSDG